MESREEFAGSNINVVGVDNINDYYDPRSNKALKAYLSVVSLDGFI
jgi:hypothetical protein